MHMRFEHIKVWIDMHEIDQSFLVISDTISNKSAKKFASKSNFTSDNQRVAMFEEPWKQNASVDFHET